MGKTPIYGLGYLEPNQDLSQNLDLDELRFRAIDTQTYSLYQIFGNGIIEDETNNNISWQISQIPSDSQNIRISSGKGFVSWKAAETTSYRDVALPILPVGVTSVKVWAYAVANDNTPVTKDVDFITSLVEISDTDNYVSLGGVVVTFGATTSVTPFTEGRVKISIIASLSGIINSHKHIGGSNNPSPINLASHVQGKLSGEYIENLDISTVTSGTLDAERLPQIDHATLKNIGTLTHTQIDALLGALSLPDSSNRLSDLSMANRLQIVLALKKNADYVGVDAKQINAIFYIPAIFPNRGTTDDLITIRDLNLPGYITEANVYDSVGGGYSPSVNFIEAAVTDAQTAFNAFYTSKSHFTTMYDYIQGKSLGTLYTNENVKILGTDADNVDGNFTIDTPLNLQVLSNAAGPDFENAAYGWNYYTKKLRNTDDTYTDTQYTVFDIPKAKRDWSQVTNIGLGINLATTDSACSIYMTLLVDPLDTRIKDTTLISETIEDRANSTVQTLSIKRSITKKIFTKGTDDLDTDIFVNVELSDLIEKPSNRVNVVGFAFYIKTDDSSTEKWNGDASPSLTLIAPTTELLVDDAGDPLTTLIDARQNLENGYLSAMFLWNEFLYAERCQYIFRIDTGSTSAQMNLYSYSLDLPTGTTYTIATRITTSSTEGDLNSLNATDITSNGVLVSGTYTNTPTATFGKWFDLIVDLYPDSERLYAPKFKDLSIDYTSVGSSQSKVWNVKHDNLATEQSGWIESEYQKFNISYGDDYTDGGFTKNVIKLTQTSDIGNWIYLAKNSAIQADQNNLTSSYEDGVDNSTSSIKNYLSPWQIFNKATTSGFYQPKDFKILWDNSAIYADTGNDRIVHFDENGSIKKLIQGNLRLKLSERDFMVLGAQYNPDIQTIYLPFSQCVTISDASKIIIIYDGIDVSCSDTNFVSSVELLTPLVNQKSATVLLKLTSKFNKLLNSATDQRVIILSGAFTSNGTATNSAETSNNTNNTGGTGSNTPPSTISPPSGSGGTGGGGSFVSFSTTTSILSSPSVKHLDVRNKLSLNGKLEIFASLKKPSEFSAQSFDFKAMGSGDTITEIFDYDGNGVSSTLIGVPKAGKTTAQTLPIELTIMSGPIFYANIYNPISVHVNNSYQYVVAQPFYNSVVCFDYDTANTLLWALSSELVSYTEGYLGSAYELANKNILVATPSTSSTALGKMMVIKRSTNSDFPIVTIDLEGDGIYAMPTELSSEYYVAVDDRFNAGKNSKLVRYNSSGKVIKSWNNKNLLKHPKGLNVLPNGDVLISE